MLECREQPVVEAAEAAVAHDEHHVAGLHPLQQRRQEGVGIGVDEGGHAALECPCVARDVARPSLSGSTTRTVSYKPQVLHVLQHIDA